ncbi:MAG: hypothetical protein Q7J10_04710 [Methanosarcinaceae archaeon]|nr:hypothetical protein [Methanosarcinaceae archaeon]
MTDIKDYASGKIFSYMKNIDLCIKLIKIPLIGTFIRKKFESKAMNKCGQFVLTSPESITSLISSAELVAAGPRICYDLYKTDLTHAVFLNELAEAMIVAGFASKVTKEDAIKIMLGENESSRPKLVSYVSGKPLELCNQSVQTCSLWKLKRAGIDIMQKEDLIKI